MAFELGRLRLAGHRPAIVGTDVEHGDTVIVDVSSPRAIASAIQDAHVVKDVFATLRDRGVSEVHPGFDMLTIIDGHIDRIIELKSSGVDARVRRWAGTSGSPPALTRSGGTSGSTSSTTCADIPAPPYVRAIHDPFGSLTGTETLDHAVRRAAQLRVREFTEVEQLVLTTAGRRS